MNRLQPTATTSEHNVQPAKMRPTVSSSSMPAVHVQGLYPVPEECLYAQSFASDHERAIGLDTFLCYYNAERPHLGLRRLTPRQRLALSPAVLPTS